MKIIWTSKCLLKHLVLFTIYGVIYFTIESLFKWQITNPLMFLVGGVLGVLIGLINNLFDMDTNFLLQCLVGMMLVLLIECIIGYECNIVRNMGLWNYSKVPFNFVGGQICVPFAFAWFGLSGICIVLDDYLRYLLFGEEKPYYIFLKRNKRRFL